MPVRSDKPSSELLRAAQDLDPERIDALYGLEPVFEPPRDGTGKGEGPQALEFAEIQCPWCGEVMGSQVDLTAGSRQYIEDCQVCCRAMEIALVVNARGYLESVTASRSD